MLAYTILYDIVHFLLLKICSLHISFYVILLSFVSYSLLAILPYTILYDIVYCLLVHNLSCRMLFYTISYFLLFHSPSTRTTICTISYMCCCIFFPCVYHLILYRICAAVASSPLAYTILCDIVHVLLLHIISLRIPFYTKPIIFCCCILPACVYYVIRLRISFAVGRLFVSIAAYSFVQRMVFNKLPFVRSVTCFLFSVLSLSDSSL